MIVKTIEELVAVPASLHNGNVTPVGSAVVSTVVTTVALTVGFNVQGSPLTCLAVEHAGRPSCSRDKNMSDPDLCLLIVFMFLKHTTYISQINLIYILLYISNITQSNIIVTLPGIVE